MKALIVEDETPAAERLKKMLATLDNSIEVLGVCDSVKSTVNWLRENDSPEVIFMDIELSDGRSFEIFSHIEVSSKLIFITAYDDFALKAIKLNALDYLLKPIDKTELEDSIKKLKGLAVKVNHPGFGELNESYQKISSGEKPKKLVVHDLTGARFINIDKILRLKADSNYTNIYLDGGETIVTSRTLKHYEELLGSMNFFRISNNYLVNLGFVEKYIKGVGGELVMTDGTTVEVSRNRKKELLEALSI